MEQLTNHDIQYATLLQNGHLIAHYKAHIIVSMDGFYSVTEHFVEKFLPVCLMFFCKDTNIYDMGVADANYSIQLLYPATAMLG